MSVLSDAISLIFTVHGRERRLLRKIYKRELNLAVKHGVKERGFPHPVTGAKRWKYTYMDVVYITDESSTKETTSCVLPMDIPEAPVNQQDVDLHSLIGEALSLHPTKTRSQVLVVDQSGSLRTCDVEDFKNRSQAVYGTIALDIVANQLDSGQATGTDAVSLVEMNQEGTVVLQRQPLTNVLYNWLVRRRLEAKPRGQETISLV
eukprot:g20981.t1